MHAHADGASFLAGVEVHEAWDLAGREFDVEPFLKLADRPHGAVRSQQLVSANLHVVSPCPIRVMLMAGLPRRISSSKVRRRVRAPTREGATANWLYRGLAIGATLRGNPVSVHHS